MIDPHRFADDVQLTHAEVGAWLGVDRATVYRNATRWGLQFRKALNSRRVTCPARLVRLLIEGNQTVAAASPAPGAS